MRCLLLLFVALLNVGTLKTETIDFARKNGRLDMIFPLSNSKGNDASQQSMDKRIPDDSDPHQWNNLNIKFPPNDVPFRKIVGMDDTEDYDLEDIDFPEEQYKSIEQMDDIELARLSTHLLKLLQDPEVWETPVVLVRDGQDGFEARPNLLELDGPRGIAKRWGRSYKQYPGKRHRDRSYAYYDQYNPCTPSKEDVFHLLVAVHDARAGNKPRIVNFCNRRRPASAVYTNIRFLGRKKK